MNFDQTARQGTLLSGGTGRLCRYLSLLVYRSSTPWFYLAVCVISVYVCATGQLTEDVKRWCRPHIRYRSTKPQYNSS